MSETDAGGGDTGAPGDVPLSLGAGVGESCQIPETLDVQTTSMTLSSWEQVQVPNDMQESSTMPESFVQIQSPSGIVSDQGQNEDFLGGFTFGSESSVSRGSELVVGGKSAGGGSGDDGSSCKSEETNNGHSFEQINDSEDENGAELMAKPGSTNLLENVKIEPLPSKSEILPKDMIDNLQSFEHLDSNIQEKNTDDVEVIEEDLALNESSEMNTTVVKADEIDSTKTPGVMNKGLSEKKEEYYSTESLQSLATSNMTSSSSRSLDFFSPAQSPRDMEYFSADNMSFKSFNDSHDSEELSFYDTEDAGVKTPQDRTPTNTPIPKTEPSEVTSIKTLDAEQHKAPQTG